MQEIIHKSSNIEGSSGTQIFELLSVEVGSKRTNPETMTNMDIDTHAG